MDADISNKPSNTLVKSILAICHFHDDSIKKQSYCNFIISLKMNLFKFMNLSNSVLNLYSIWQHLVQISLFYSVTYLNFNYEKRFSKAIASAIFSKFWSPDRQPGGEQP